MSPIFLNEIIGGACCAVCYPGLTLARRRMTTKSIGWRGWLVRVLLLALFLFLLRTDDHHLSPATAAASAHLFALEEWIVENVEDKWRHRARRLVPPLRLSREEQVERMEELFQVQQDVRAIRWDIARAAATGTAHDRDTLEDFERRLSSLLERREALRDDVEELLESELSAVIAEAGLRRGAGVFQAVFPPVDFRLDSTPTVLVVSPRDRIRLTETVLLDGDGEVSEWEAIEEGLAADHNLSALVVPIAGLAAYPSIVSGTRDLRRTLEVVAHEWLHHYWFFHPLGFNYFASAEMTTLNETAADIAGRELGDLAYERLTGVRPPSPSAPSQGSAAERAFDFGDAMRETRRTVDAMLAQGRVDEAEQYMEERRRLFVANGYAIRVLNQAYFAFHGTYAESPASVSPIAGQLHELRERSATLGEFVRTVARFDTYDAFLAYLEE